MQVLLYRGKGELVTGDVGCAIVLGKLPEAVLQQCGDQLKHGTLLRFKVGTGGFFLDDTGSICGADLHLVGVANQTRKADLYSRIVFQWQLRTHQVNMQSLLERLQQMCTKDSSQRA